MAPILVLLPTLYNVPFNKAKEPKLEAVERTTIKPPVGEPAAVKLPVIEVWLAADAEPVVNELVGVVQGLAVPLNSSAPISGRVPPWL